MFQRLRTFTPFPDDLNTSGRFTRLLTHPLVPGDPGPEQIQYSGCKPRVTPPPPSPAQQPQSNNEISGEK